MATLVSAVNQVISQAQNGVTKDYGGAKLGSQHGFVAPHSTTGLSNSGSFQNWLEGNSFQQGTSTGSEGDDTPPNAYEVYVNSDGSEEVHYISSFGGDQTDYVKYIYRNKIPQQGAIQFRVFSVLNWSHGVGGEVLGNRYRGNGWISDGFSATRRTPGKKETVYPGASPALEYVDLTSNFAFGAELLTARAVGKIGFSLATKASSSVTRRECMTFGLNSGTNYLSKSELLRIENAATRINRPITVVGSRANGTSNVFSDWDYVITGINSKSWSKIKNSLPGSGSRIDNSSRNIDIFRGPLDLNRPHITINPR